MAVIASTDVCINIVCLQNNTQYILNSQKLLLYLQRC